MKVSGSPTTSPRPASDRRFPLIPMLAVFVAAALTVAIVALPASFLGRFLPPGAQIEDFSGTVWHGSAGSITLAGHPAGGLEWRLHPLALLRMHIDADVRWVRRSVVLEGRVSASRGALTLSDAAGGGPLEDLSDLGLPLGWRGLIGVHLREAGVQWSNSNLQLRSAVGELSLKGASAAQFADGADLGDYTLRFANPALAAGAEAVGVLKDEGGPLDLQATIQVALAERRATLSGTVRARPGAPPALQHLIDDLGVLHARDAQGRLPLDAEFTL